MCVSRRGGVTREGLKSSGSLWLVGEMGLWDYEVKVEEGEKAKLEDGRAEKVESEEWKGQINASMQQKLTILVWRKTSTFFKVVAGEVCL